MFGLFKRRPRDDSGPDFSVIDTREKADAMFRRGELERILLVPLEFGGADDPRNMLYVPIGTGAIKRHFDFDVVAALAREGKASQYDADVEYQGKSVIPIAIKITASNPGSFTNTIKIWGDALGRGDG